MHQNYKPAGIRTYKPAAVLVIDLVKHSVRGKKSIQLIQQAMDEVFEDTIKRLKIDEVYFNYKGDGYICTLAGDSSVRILDFINFSFPNLLLRIAPHNQQLRAGLDFGIVQLRLNPLTGAQEHFDLPGINAARLEASAESGQILCTNTVYDMFALHYPEMFSKNPKVIKSKDRKILSYQILPIDAEQVKQLFSNFLFNKIEPHSITPKIRNKILIVDDAKAVVENLEALIQSILPHHEIIVANNGEEALKIFIPGEFALILTDIAMPGLSGLDITERFITEDPEQIIIMITGYYTNELVEKFISIGGLTGLAKPLDPKQIKNIIGLVIASETLSSIKSKLQLVCDEPGVFLLLVVKISDRLDYILEIVSDQNDIAHGLLRHKAKYIVMNLIQYLRPGSDIINFMKSALTQLECIERLSRPVVRVKVKEFELYLQQIIDDLKKSNPKIRFILKCSFPKSPWEAMPFATITALIIFELIDNAISAIDGEGKIEIEMALLETTGMVNIIVRDNGSGIPSELIEKAFEEGVTTKGTGHGLGLSLILEAAHLLHGTITYNYDNGAVFRVTLYPFT